MKNRIKKQKCSYHENDRDLSEYVFWVTDIRKPKHVDIYECKKCKDHLDRAIERSERIRAHNEIQRKEANARSDRRLAKWREKRDKSIKEDIWDDEVKKELCKGMKLRGHTKYLYKENIPKEVLQLKRASMKLERLIASVKSSGEKSIIIEEKPISPIKKCLKHGDLFLPDVIKSGKSRWTGEQVYKCRQCMSDLHRNYYDRRKEYVLQKHAEYREKYPERRKQTKTKYWRNKSVENNKHEATAR